MNWCLLLSLLLIFLPTVTHAFFQSSILRTFVVVMASPQDDTSPTPSHPFCELPGDPSLILTTNVDLGAKKLDVMKGKLLMKCI